MITKRHNSPTRGTHVCMSALDSKPVPNNLPEQTHIGATTLFKLYPTNGTVTNRSGLVNDDQRMKITRNKACTVRFPLTNSALLPSCDTASTIAPSLWRRVSMGESPRPPRPYQRHSFDCCRSVFTLLKACFFKATGDDQSVDEHKSTQKKRTRYNGGPSSLD